LASFLADFPLIGQQLAGAHEMGQGRFTQTALLEQVAQPAMQVAPPPLRSRLHGGFVEANQLIAAIACL
jgi:hypothetical protein